MYLPNYFVQVGCDTRSIFKQSLTSFEFRVLFPKIGYLTKSKELCSIIYR